jgi:hypothetical protein
MKNTLRTICFILLAFPAIAQEQAEVKPSSTEKQEQAEVKPSSTKNTVYFELGGIGYKYSFNYQRNFLVSKHFDIAAGASINPFLIRRDDYNTRTKITPTAALTLQGIYNFGKNEVALGVAYGCYTYYGYYWTNKDYILKMEGATMTFASLGYGHTWGKHIYTGAYFWLHVASHGYTEFLPWGGLRLGYKFGK